MIKPVVTSIVGKNEDLICEVSHLYLTPGMIIADITCGNGNFWKKVDTSIYDFRPSDLRSGVDCRALPYADSTIDVVVFDPPYLYGSGTPIREDLDTTYHNNERGTWGEDAVLMLYYDGIKEASRVLKKGGQVWVKCMDQISSGKQRWQAITDIPSYLLGAGFELYDLFILTRTNVPIMRHDHQVHARKNHSYLWIGKKS